MTIKRIMIGCFAVLSVLLFVSQGLLFRQAYTELAKASAAIVSNLAVSDLLKAFGQWALEREITNAALNDPNPAAPEVIKKIAGAREASGRAFQQAMDNVNIASLTIDDTHKKIINTALEKVGELRKAIDVFLTHPKAERDATIAEAWVPALNSLIMEMQKLHVNLSSQALVGEVALGKDMLIRHSLWMMTEYAERERAIIGSAIATNQLPLPDQLQELAAFRGKVEDGWNIVSNLYLSPEEHAVFDAPIAAARDNFFGSFEKIRQKIYADIKLAAVYSINAHDWIARSTQAIDTLVMLQEVNTAWTAASMQKNKMESGQALLFYGIGISVALLFVAIALWVILVRVVRPINILSSSMNVIASGEYNNQVPYLNGTDEIEYMAESFEVFRQNGLEKIRLEAKAEEIYIKVREEKKK